MASSKNNGKNSVKEEDWAFVDIHGTVLVSMTIIFPYFYTGKSLQIFYGFYSEVDNQELFLAHKDTTKYTHI